MTPAAGRLSDFLRARRAALSPEDVGLATSARRRVPGLRREELALLAGVSATYYARLEQGHAEHASASVLDALATALRLDPDERAHLHALAGAGASIRPQATSTAARQLLNAMPGAAAVLLGPRMEVLAWNVLGHALLAGHLEPQARPNLVRMLFLDPEVRALHRDWEGEALLAVSSLRFLAADLPDDPQLTALVGELTMKSPAFADLWARHPVVRCTSGVKRFQHAAAGAFDLDYQVLHLPDASGQRLLAHTAAPGSAGARALTRLAGAGGASVRPLVA